MKEFGERAGYFRLITVAITATLIVVLARFGSLEQIDPWHLIGLAAVLLGGDVADRWLRRRNGK